VPQVFDFPFPILPYGGGNSNATPPRTSIPKLILAAAVFFARRGKVFADGHFSALRRGIFVEPQSQQNFSPGGAAYSEDAAPERSF
jgi:hypothetical protein